MILLAETGLDRIDYVVLFVYLAIIVVIGLYFSRGKGDTETYLLGGRRVTWWAVGLSYVVSVTSTLSVVGVPEEAYKEGVTLALGIFLVPFTAVASFFIFVRFYFKVLTFTPFSYLERRFDVRVRAIAAGLFCIVRLTYIALVLYSSSKVLKGTANWNIETTIILIGAVGIGYTVLGGIRAVIWTDVIQFAIMAGGIAYIAVTVVKAVPDGTAGIFQFAIENDHFIRKPEHLWSFSPFIRVTIWLAIMQSVNESLFFHSSDQISLQRMLSTSGYDQAKKALYTRVIVDLPMMLSLYFIGLGIWVFYQQQFEASARPEADMAFFQFITSQLPPAMPGLMVAAMMAAVMSTLDSGINSLATVFTKDFYQRFSRKNVSERKQVVFSQWMTLMTGVCATAMALLIAQFSKAAKTSVMESSYLFMSFTSIVPAIFVLAVFSRRIRSNHILIAASIGTLVISGMIALYVTQKFILSKPEEEIISVFYLGASGLTVTVVTGFIISRFFPRADDRDIYDLTLWTLSKKKQPA